MFVCACLRVCVSVVFACRWFECILCLCLCLLVSDGVCFVIVCMCVVLGFGCRCVVSGLRLFVVACVRFVFVCGGVCLCVCFVCCVCWFVFICGCL